MSSKQFDRPNVLVAGGAGFIGANICEALLDEYNVVCLDDYSFGHESAIDELLGSPHFEFIRHDIREVLDLSSHASIEKFRIAHVGFQHVIHAAGAGSCAAVARDPIGADRTLAEGTRHLLDMAVASHARFYLLSDALVYGAAGATAWDEESEGALFGTPLVQRIAEAKRFAETMAKTYAEQYSLEVAIIRLGVTYGPRMFLGDGRFISTLIEHALSKKSLPLLPEISDLQALFSRDMTDAIKKFLASGRTGVYNLSGATAYPLAEINECIGKEIGSGLAAGGSSPDSDTAAFWKAQSVPLSIHKIKEAIGWFPIVRVEDGMHETVEYLKSLRGVVRL